LDSSTRSICYTALGLPQDASDDLVSFAYREQIRADPKESPLYLTYLREIATSRRSEPLNTLVATEYSAGRIDSKQLNEAYRYFSFSPRSEGISDDLIIGNFQSRLQDAPKQEAEMRAHLKTIAEHRHSRRIRDTADETLKTYEQALAFFDAQTNVADEFIPTLYTTKVSTAVTHDLCTSRRELC
jgi:ubiquitin carboxyl-terminal hydrolase 25